MTPLNPGSVTRVESRRATTAPTAYALFKLCIPYSKRYIANLASTRLKTRLT